MFISLHQDPRTIYPGTGFIEQIGEGEGEGYNANLPLPPGTGDQTYLYALKEIFPPLAEEFKPEIIIANGGSDPHFADVLGNLGLTVNGFFALSHTIAEVADSAGNPGIPPIRGNTTNSRKHQESLQNLQSSLRIQKCHCRPPLNLLKEDIEIP